MKILIKISLTLIAISCSNKSNYLNMSLEGSGDNISELEKVIQYYSEKEEDSLKLKAAIFLIEYMPFYGSYYGARVDSVNQGFNQLINIERTQPKVEDRDRKRITIEMLKKYSSSNKIDDFIADNRKITFEYLTTNIESAFRAWRNASWKDSISFEIFCEYILPYRIRSEKLEYWRNDIINNYMLEQGSTEGLNNLNNNFYNIAIKKDHPLRPNKYYKNYKYDMNFSQMNLLSVGSCIDNTCYNLYQLRTIGIPATYDFVTNWGNRPVNLHAIVGNAAINKQSPKLFSNENKPVDINNRIGNNMKKPLNYYFKKEELPQGLYVQHVKTVPKMWRYTWSINDQVINIYKNIPENQIYKSLLKINTVDVSNEYIDAADVKIKLNNEFEEYDIVYLAVFGRNDWEPVAYSVPDKEGLVLFKDMGKNILYLPVVYDTNRCIPVGNPFVIETNGRIKQKTIRNIDKQNMKLIRKFPFFSHIAKNSYNLKGICFEGANNPEFKDAHLLHSVNYYPNDMIKIKVNNIQKFRYVRCRFNDNLRTEIAQIKYFSKNDTKLEELKGDPFLHTKYNNKKLMERSKNAFDNDLLSLFTFGAKHDSWLGLDLGENNARQISEIHFCARTDANFIVPNNHYELYYWDNKWILFDDKIADDYFLEFRGVPSGGVYWLKCTTEGKEERAFTYEKNGQVWW